MAQSMFLVPVRTRGVLVSPEAGPDPNKHGGPALVARGWARAYTTVKPIEAKSYIVDNDDPNTVVFKVKGWWFVCGRQDVQVIAG